MNEQLQQELLKIIQETKAFTIEQAPDVVQQVLGAAVFDSGLSIAFGAALFLVSVAVFLWGVTDDLEFTPVISFIFAILALLFTTCSYSEYYQAKHFPKAYLIKKIRGECR